jgi:tRNA(fMet)-specific endonuclease VapC
MAGSSRWSRIVLDSMTFLLDTNTVIALLHPARRETLLGRITSHDPGQVATSSIVSYELYYGAHKSTQRADNLRRLAMLLRDIEPLAFTPDDAEAAGEIRATLGSQGTPIGPYDVLIAGQARSRDLVLVTNNTREFRRVENLTVVDWLTES